MEISDFLRKREPLPTLPGDYKENAEWEEERLFNAWIKKLEKPRDFDPFGQAGFAHLWLQYD